MLAQLGDVHIHAAGIEIIVVNPDGLQGKVTLQYLVGMRTQQAQQLRLLRGQLRLLLRCGQNLLLRVKRKLTYLINIALLILLATHTTQDSLDAEPSRI